MLWALKQFYELIVFTSKTKTEAEAIIKEIEKGENFFTYIIPANYCYFVKEHNFFVKDINIFLGNRQCKNIIMVTTSPYDCLLHINNSLPIVPYQGEANDCLLQRLEKYLIELRFAKDVTEQLYKDFHCN